MKIRTFGIAAVIMLMLAVVAVSPVMAHHNMFQKAAHAVQYTTRKDAENLSIDTHRLEKKNSVQHVRNHHYRQIITPAGDKVWLHHHYHHKHAM